MLTFKVYLNTFCSQAIKNVFLLVNPKNGKKLALAYHRCFGEWFWD